jgi:hypothetical protein
MLSVRGSFQPSAGCALRWDAYPRALAIARLLPAVHLVFKADGSRENFKLQPVCLLATLRNHRHGFIRVRALLRIGAERSHNVVVGLARQHAGIDVRSSRL